MEVIGIQELKERTEAILKGLRGNNKEIIITSAGEVLAVVKGVTKQQAAKLRKEKIKEFFTQSEKLSKEISKVRKDDASSVELIREQRR